MKPNTRKLAPYRQSLAGALLAAREAVMAPIRPHLREAGLTEQQWRVLRVLEDERSIDPTRLADSALLFPPSVTRILKELVDRGVIVRESDAHDRRRSILHLSASGKVLVRETAQHAIQTLDQYTELFGQERLRKLIEELHALTETISIAPEQAPRSPQPPPG